MRLLFRVHGLAIMVFACLSSDAADGLGLGAARMPVFLAVAFSLVGFAVAVHPFFDQRLKTIPLLILGLLVLGMALDLRSSVDPLDYRLALPLLIIIFAPNISRMAHHIRLENELVILLIGYVALAFALLPAATIRGGGGPPRLDIFGSVITLGAISMIAVITFIACAIDARRLERKLAYFALALAAAMLVVLSGSRTPLLALAIAGAMAMFLGPVTIRASSLMTAGMVGIAAGAVLFLSGAAGGFLARLTGAGLEDYTSGRLASQLWWLEQALAHPLGLGFGTIREMLNEGRTSIFGDQLLEWPHNEFIRFFVDGGVVGFFIILVAVFWITHNTARAVQRSASATRNGLMLALTADLIAQSLFQNYFNSVYYATAMLLVLALLWLDAHDEARGSHEWPTHDDNTPSYRRA